MKLFISWSGARSKQLAHGLYGWLPGVINAVEPWLSETDIDPGARWGTELAQELEKTRYGVICVTAENMNAPWLLFEAGALSRYVEKTRVVPLLLEIKSTDIKGPLSQFQSVQANEDDIKKLVTGINLTVFESGEKGMDKSYINDAFQLWWPKLKLVIDNIPKSIPPDVKTDSRSEREIMEETLSLVRKLSRELRPTTPRRAYNTPDDMPPPPDNFPDDWDEMWQPSFEETVIRSTPKPKPKTNK